MREALICEPLRTPVGRYGGVFRGVAVADLATTVIKAVVERSGIPRERIDDVLLGQGYSNGEAPALGRVAALDAMERHLDGRTWLVGDGMTLADIALYAYTHVADEGSFELDRYPAIGAWLERVASEPGHVPIDA